MTDFRASVLDAIVRCFQDPDLPVRLDQNVWPILLQINRADVNAKELTATVESLKPVMKDLQLLIEGASLGNWIPPVPVSHRQNRIILSVKTCTAEKHYGLGKLKYIMAMTTGPGKLPIQK